MDLILKRPKLFISIGIASSIVFIFFAAYYPLICLVTVFGLLTFLVSLYFKEKVFYAFIFLFPLIPNFFAFDLGGSLPLITVGRLLLIYVISFDLIFNRDKFRKLKKSSKETNIVIFSTALIIFSYIINYFIYPDVESLKILISFLLENVIIAVYCFFRIRSCEDVEKFIRCFLYAALFVAITGIAEFIFKVNIFSFLDIVKSNRQLLSSDVYERLGEIRVEGPFGHPLAYCNFLLIAIPMGVYEWQKGKTTKVKLRRFIIILILLVNFLFTLSRGPMLALLAGTLLYFVFTNKRNKQILFMFAIIFFGVLCIGIISGALPGFIKYFLLSLIDSVLMRTSGGGFGGNSNASSYRLYLFDLAKKLVSGDNIWFGRGVSFFRINEVYDWVPGISNTREIKIVSVDNYYILKYIEMGLSGILSTLVFIFSLIYSCIANFFKTGDKEFNLCFLFIFISYFISLFTVDEIGTLRFIWIITGIIASKFALYKKI